MPVMPSYPGVYIEEVPSGVRTITPVSTSTTAFLGRASRGPINQAVRIFSLADYSRAFGPPHPRSDLAESVRLFFLNGGADAYVVRLANGAMAAAVTLRSLGGTNALRATAKAEGVWANTVRLEVDYNTLNPDETFNLRVIHESEGRVAQSESFVSLSMDPASPRFAPRFVSQSSELIELELHAALGDPGSSTAVINTLGQSFPGFSQARRPLGTLANVRATLDGLVNGATPRSRFLIRVNDAPEVPVNLAPWSTATINGSTLAQLANHVQQQIDTALAGVQPVYTVTCSFEDGPRNFLTIQAADGDRASVRVRRAPAGDIAAALMLGVEQGGIEPVRRSNFRPAPTATFLRLGTANPTSLGEATQLLNGLANLQQNVIQSLDIDGTPVPLDLVTTGGTDPWFNSEPVPDSPHGDNDGVREKLRLIATGINSEPGLPYRAEVWGYHLALLALEPPIDARPLGFSALDSTPAPVPAFNNALTVNSRRYSLGEANDATLAPVFVDEQVAGDDGTVPLAGDYQGDPLAQTGLFALDPVDLFNLMVIPGDEEVTQATFNQIWGPASVYCQSRRAFLIIDPPQDWTVAGRPAVVQNTALITDLRSLVVSDHSAVFYPRIQIASGGLVRTIGPAGAVAGVMARIDSSRGVWKAPAGNEADLRGTLGLQLKLTDMENGVLNKQGVNALRAFPNGRVVWGARTLAGMDDSPSEWKYIPIRRLALFLEESLYRGTKWVVFEPNDEPLWAQIRQNLNAFMMGLFRQGAFQGSTPREAFYVKCDRETTTQADRNLGIVNIEVGFAPLKPAEFVIIRIQQIAGEL